GPGLAGGDQGRPDAAGSALPDGRRGAGGPTRAGRRAQADGRQSGRAQSGRSRGAGDGEGRELALAVLTMRDALNQAMKEEMARDPSVFILGEEVGAYQGAYKVTQGLLAQFGEWRVRDTPIAEE